MKRFATILACSMVVSACGGGGGSGGGGSSPTTSGSTSTTFLSSAAVGELMEFTVDTTSLSYSYKIVESAWGLAGQTGSGTLTKNSDGTYTPSEASNARLIVGNGVMIGAVALNLGGGKKVVPFYGVSSLVNTFADAAGTYNFVDRDCTSYTTCSAAYGTIKVEATGNWTACRSGDIRTNPACATSSGTLNALGNGRFQISGTSAEAWFAKTGTERIIVIDTYTAGRGATLVGSDQGTLSNATADGNWFAYHAHLRHRRENDGIRKHRDDAESG